MIDLVTLKLVAGSGGNGRVSFRREKFVPKGGPDGGQGGNGGSIIIRGTKHLNTLKHFAGVKQVVAQAGQPGGRKKQAGAKGEDTVVEVPVGTVIWMTQENQASVERRRFLGIELGRDVPDEIDAEAEESRFAQRLSRGDVQFEKYYLEYKETEPIPYREDDALQETEKTWLVTIDQEGQELVLCQGGFGGRGNWSFKGPAKTTPLEAEYGTFGEAKEVVFELKLLADIGLVGFPNAGKSTLLSRITKANPKIANYPFTTLEPNLGILESQAWGIGGDTKMSLVVADIPGLIEGASEGKGLGLDFLRHVENSRVLLYVLFLDEAVAYSGQSPESLAELLWQQYLDLQEEMKAYNPKLLEKPALVSLNKVDIYTSEQLDVFRSAFEQKNINVIPFSAATNQNMETLVKRIWETLQ